MAVKLQLAQGARGRRRQRTTMVEINKMTSPDYLIEINAIAVLPK